MMKRLLLLSFIAILVSCHHKGVIEPVVIEGLVSPGNGDTVHTRHPEFVWCSKEPAEAYHMQIDDLDSFYSPVSEDTTITDTVFSCPDTLEEGTYHWRVRAKTDGYWGEWSDVAAFHVVLNPYYVLGHAHVSGYARAVLVDGSYAYIAAGEGCLSVVDVSVPASPLEVATGDVVGQHLAVNLGKLPGDSVLIIADSYQMLKIFNVADPGDPRFIGDGQVWMRYVRDVAMQERGDAVLVFIATRDDGLRVHDNGDPSYPNFLEERGSAQLPGASNAVFPQGVHAFIANGELGLQIVEVSDSIFIAGSEDTPGYAEDVYVCDGIAYIADGYSGLSIIDVGDPTAPSLLSTLDVSGYQQGVCVQECMVYVAGSEGFYVVDASDLTAPTVLGHLETEYGYDIFADGDYIYLADRSGLYVVARHDW
jgi:hypothetical protein